MTDVYSNQYIHAVMMPMFRAAKREKKTCRYLTLSEAVEHSIYFISLKQHEATKLQTVCCFVIYLSQRIFKKSKNTFTYMYGSRRGCFL